MKYRAEIDGLRAVAVVPVILFHAGFGAFAGGFIGVDVFFVISGFLITGLILPEIAERRFSIIDFYERRARRILPALVVVVLASLPLAWHLLTPPALRDFAQSLLGVATFASNIVFWRESGYFDTAAELKPLLHTWSLAVEEQYYIVFPLLLMAMRRMGRRAQLMTLAAISMGSLAWARWASWHWPDAAFFLLPFRFWELAAGAMLAVAMQHRGRLPAASPAVQWGSLLGLLLVAGSMVLFTKGTPHPSLYTLIPVAGTVLIIGCAVPGTWVHALLASRGFVGIGLLSYSLYLWHQPMFVFARFALDAPGPGTMLLLTLLSVLLAFLSWKFVETPWRVRRRVSRLQVGWASAAALCLLATVGVAGHQTRGFEALWMARQSPDTVATYRIVQRQFDAQNGFQVASGGQADGPCRFSAAGLRQDMVDRFTACAAAHGPGYVVLGDSHAIDLFSALLGSTKKPFLVSVTIAGCRPHTPGPHCHYDPFLNLVAAHRDLFRGVIFEQAGFYLLRRGGHAGDRRMLSSVALDEPYDGIVVDRKHVAATLAYLEALSEVTPVLWFGPRLEPQIPEETVLARGCKYPFQLRPNQRELFDTLDRYIEDAAAVRGKVHYLSQNQAYRFQFPADYMDCNHRYWVDGDHFSAEGERRFGPRFDLLNALDRSVAVSKSQ